MVATAPWNDGIRSPRDGECVVDCAKALTAFEASQAATSEERAAQNLGISRSVLRRILGKDDATGRAIVTIPNARSFAERCGVRLAAIQWMPDPLETRSNGQSSTAGYLQRWRGVFGLHLTPLVPLNMSCNEVAIDAEGIIRLLESNPTLQARCPSGCGKSHLLTHLAMTMSPHEYIPVFVRAADFDGDMDALLDRSVMTVASPQLYPARQSLQQEVVATSRHF